MGSKLKCDVWEHFENIIEEGVAVCKLCRARLKNDRTESLRRHLKRLHNKKSEIWKYFNTITEEGFVECKQCKQLVRNNRCFNLQQHMLKAHNLAIHEIESESSTQKEQLRPTATRTSLDLTRTESSFTINTDDESIDDDDNMHDATSVTALEGDNEETQHHTQNSNTNRNFLSSAKLNKPYRRSRKFIGIEMEEKVIKTAVWGLMIEEGVPPSLFDSKNMHALIQPICEAISIQKEREFKINAAEREGVLSSVANHLCNDFSNDLHWRLLSLKMDMDLNGPANTFCISVSFVNDGKVQTRILGVIDLNEDFQVIEKNLNKVLHKFNIDADQIIYACWDNTKQKYNTCVKNSEYLDKIVKIEKNPCIQVGAIKIERYVGSIAQLCLLDIFKNNDILQPFLNCRNFVKFISDESNGFYDVFEKNKLNIPQLDSPWKWGSTYEMLSDLQDARKLLETNTYPELQSLEDHFEVNDNVWLFVDAFCESLKHIQKSITKYYTDEMHFGDFFAQWLKCKLLTQKSAATDKKENNFVHTISSQLLKSIEIRTKDILSEGAFQACLYMDPRFQHTLDIEEKSKAADYLNNIWSRSKIYNPDLENAFTKFLKETQQPRDFNDDEDALLNEFLSQDAQKADSRTQDIYTKIKELKLPFQSVDTNILLFWNNLKATDPEMFFLSSICFAIPTTQNYNKDRYAHIYQAENTSKLSDSIRDNLLIVRLNSEFLVDDLRQFGIFCEGKPSDYDLLQVL